jgi:hypothetical protein
MKIRTTIVGLIVAISAAGTVLSQPLPVCQTGELSIRQNGPGVAMGKLHYDFVLTNRGNRVCTLSGYPVAIALDKDGQIAKQIQFRQDPAMAHEPDGLLIEILRLRPGAHAWFEVTSSDGMGMEDFSLCGKVAHLQITPPGNGQPFPRRFPFAACTETQGIAFLLPGLP